MFTRPLTMLADSLERSGVQYCILHGWQSLPKYLSSDLDMVIAHKDLSVLERILRNHSLGQLVQLLQHETSGYYFVLSVAKEHKKGFMLVDVATDYRVDGCVFFRAEELLATRQECNKFWVAGPDIEFAYLLIKKVSKGSFPWHQKARIRDLQGVLDQRAYGVTEKLFGPVWGHQFMQWIVQSNWVALEASLPYLRRRLRLQMVKRDLLNPLRYWLPELRRMWQRWRYPTGLLVAVMGPDGAGKTTLIYDLRNNLAGAFRRTEIFHLRPSVMGPKGRNAPVTDPHEKAPHPWWLSPLKIPYYFLDYGLGYLFKVRPHLVRSTLVLFDRYYDDLLVDPRRYRYGGPYWFARLARHFIPRPDLFLMLDVPEEELLARKQEVLLEELRRQRQAYRKLAMEFSNTVLLDGSLGPKEVVRNASEATLDYLHQRYLKRRYLWFRDNGSETLNWLESVLFSSDKSRLALSNSPQYGVHTQWQTNASFGWLSLKDGRGYLIPMDSRQTRVEALRLYNAQNLKAKIAKKLLALGLRVDVAWPRLRKVHVFNRAYVQEKEKRQTSLLEHLKEILARPDITFAISFGTPGSHRKPVIELLDDKGGVLGFAKIGWNEATNALVRNEADVSRYLSRVSFNSFVVPTMLYAGWWEDRFLCIQSPPDGKIETAPQKLTLQYLSVLEELKSFHIRSMPLKESAFWKNFLQRIESIQGASYRHVLHQGACEVEEWLADTPLPFHFSHNDFAPWNAQLLNSRLFLFDWEYADLEAPPLWDLFHFIVQTLWLLQKRTPAEIYKSVLEDGRQHESIRLYLGSLNMKEGHLRPLFVLYLLNRLAFYVADHDADQGSIRYFGKMLSLILSDEKCSR